MSQATSRISWRERVYALGSLACGLLLVGFVVGVIVRNLGFLAFAIQPETVASNSSGVIPACAAAPSSSIPRVPAEASTFRFFARAERNGSFDFHFGCRPASDLILSIRNASSTGAGSSGQSVPSWLNTATRSSGGT